jgi:hypothetical protein
VHVPPLSAYLTHLPDGSGSFGAWNECLSHVLSLSHAYVESVVHKCFLRAVEGAAAQAPESRSALRALADCYALGAIAGDAGFYRNDEYIAPPKVLVRQGRAGQRDGIRMGACKCAGRVGGTEACASMAGGGEREPGWGCPRW